MTVDVLANLKNRVFFHGTSLESAERIAQEGFKAWRYDEEIGKYLNYGGNLGIGIYVSCNWRVALWFGSTLLRVTLNPNTRLLDSTVPPDASVLRYLRREFGHAILNEPPWKTIPRNKQLKLDELIALFRYHYQRTWDKQYRMDWSAWPKTRDMHAKLLRSFRSLLIRYGFQGYGDPGDELGIVLFSDDRIKLVEVIADLPEVRSRDYWEDESCQFKSLDQIRDHFRVHGSKRAKELARAVAVACVNIP